MLTGEPVPVHKTLGDPVMGGTVNQNGLIYIKVTRVGSDTALARIVKLVHEAQTNKAPIQSTVDDISKFFVPFVMFCSLLTLFVWLSLYSTSNIPYGWIPPYMSPFVFALRFSIAVLVIAW